MKKLLCIILCAAFIVSFVACDSSEKWPDTNLAKMIPTPSGSIDKVIDNSDSFHAYIKNSNIDDYETYVKSCKAFGYHEELEESSTSFTAFNSEGYKLHVSIVSSTLNIDLDAPIRMVELRWPNTEAGSQIPKPNSSLASFNFEHSDEFSVYVGNMDRVAFSKYVDECIEAGFIVDYSRGETYFMGDNDNGYHLNISYEGYNTILVWIKKTNADDRQTSEEPDMPTVTDVPSSTPPAAIESPSSTNNIIDASTLRPEIKEAIDSYEVFVDEYCEFMKTYDESNAAQLLQYSNYLMKAADMLSKFEKIENEELTERESMYYAEVSLRCSQKMIEASK